MEKLTAIIDKWNFFFYFFLTKNFPGEVARLELHLVHIHNISGSCIWNKCAGYRWKWWTVAAGPAPFPPAPQRNMPHFNQNYLPSQSPPTRLALLPANTNVIIKVCTMLSRPSRDCCSAAFASNWLNNDETCTRNVQFASAKCVRMFSFQSLWFFFPPPQDNDVRIIIGQFDENLASKVFCCVSVTMSSCRKHSSHKIIIYVGKRDAVFPSGSDECCFSLCLLQQNDLWNQLCTNMPPFGHLS